MGDSGKIFVFILCIIVIFTLVIVAINTVRVHGEKMTVTHPLFCRVQDLNSTFLSRIVTGKFTEFVIYTAQIETDSSITPNSGVTTTSIDNFRTQVLAKVPTAKFYAWIWSHTSTDPTTPNISTVGARTTLINNIKTFINTTYAGRFDGVLDDMESWSGMAMADRYAFVTQCATACDSLFDYYPWMYYAYVGNITSTHVAVGLYDTYAYNQSAAPLWKTAFDFVKNNTTSASYWIFIITPDRVGDPSIATQIGWLNDQLGGGAYPKLSGFGMYWYYSMDAQDWLDWNNYVSSSTSYMITASADAHSTISPSGYVSVASGGSQTFTYSALTGYHILQVLVDGVAI